LDRPLVSVIIPCYREEKTIGQLLRALRGQTYPVDRMEVVVADGLSDDRTREELGVFSQSFPELRLRVVDNPDRIIPAALNRAIRASKGVILLRLDGHSEPEPDYVETCVRLLEEGKGDMVGGGLNIVPRDGSWAARSIAAAVSHPAGVGDAHFRFSNRAQEVDTIAFCAFRREWIDRIGYYDETLRTNEDYEFNSRFRHAGGRIWLDPSSRTRYFPPATFSALVSQYWRYGFWKAKMARRRPRTLRWRQILPPSGVLMAGALLFGGFCCREAWWVLGGCVLLYSVVLGLVGIDTSLRRQDRGVAIGVPVAILLMHWIWGAAFLAGLFSTPEKVPDLARPQK
jgi:succinoglycan biosynthesis protein ExoA